MVQVVATYWESRFWVWLPRGETTAFAAPNMHISPPSSCCNPWQTLAAVDPTCWPIGWIYSIELRARAMPLGLPVLAHLWLAGGSCNHSDTAGPLARWPWRCRCRRRRRRCCCGCCWLLLALLVVVGCFWSLLVVVGCCCLSLFVVVCCFFVVFCRFFVVVCWLFVGC